MDSKPRPQSKTATPKPGSVSKRGKGIAETARLFLDMDEIIRRPQTVSFSRYVE